ncbi:hypothetical protein AALO_G00077190 [Alosa alosa]|uniref:Uncharacterized protein n=1 Tax=Alosa alosa TaxID=278164 RepID=A0AAV6H1A5_9TELE|nr:hypothetical protein AALO_G00077190 [Alosa alosa]
MDIMPVKRRREVNEGTRQRQRDVTIKYSVLKEDKTRVPVCQASFLSIFCVKKDRVQGIAKMPAIAVQAFYEEVLSSAGDRDIEQDLEDE